MTIDVTVHANEDDALIAIRHSRKRMLFTFRGCMTTIPSGPSFRTEAIPTSSSNHLRNGSRTARVCGTWRFGFVKPYVAANANYARARLAQA